METKAKAEEELKKLGHEKHPLCRAEVEAVATAAWVTILARREVGTSTCSKAEEAGLDGCTLAFQGYLDTVAPTSNHGSEWDLVFARPVRLLHAVSPYPLGGFILNGRPMGYFVS
ncbi:hypothetical protein GOP47_0020582 [Adiantum capillus-veneris]|uniref:Uncharacterized protein n=1 Tax=Adiantum capillus-veneris TaxID=13818 RepID=A0A9D4UA90_ADICA|nr:hypothetical protein GOP47_0020582 [Adiantum capillus-veneris]